MNSIFQEALRAAVPDPVACLGVRLRPFSMGALLLLMRFRNAFILRPVDQLSAESLAARPVPLGDLLQGVIVCSLKFHEAQEALSSPDLTRDVYQWSTRLRGGIFRRRLPASKARFKAMVARAQTVFGSYVATGMEYPCTKCECGPGRPIGSPWLYFTLTSMLCDLGIDLDTALNQPLAFSRWLVAANGERKGTLEICDREEISDLQAEADKIAAEVFAEMERGKPPLS